MPARTGEQFLKGLRGPREVWVDGERISDVVDHPKLRGAAHALAEVFDLHHQHPDILPDAGSRDRRADHRQPHDPALARGPFAPRQGAAPRRRVFGRPDGPHARLHERHLRRLRRQSRRVGATTATRPAPSAWSPTRSSCAASDISLTHTIVQPTVDKTMGDAPQAGNPDALRKVADTEHGIVVRGARILATLAPFADEIAVYPGAAAARRRRRLCAVVLHPHERARAEVPVPRQRLGVAATASTIRCRAASTSRTPS